MFGQEELVLTGGKEFRSVVDKHYQAKGRKRVIWSDIQNSIKKLKTIHQTISSSELNKLGEIFSIKYTKLTQYIQYM